MPVSPKHKISIPDKAPQWSAGDSLGQKLERALTRFLQDVATWGVDLTVDVLEAGADRMFRILKPGFIKVLDPLLKRVEDDKYLPKELKDVIANFRREEGEGAIAAGVVYILPIIAGVIITIFYPLIALAQHEVDRFARSDLPNPRELLEMIRRIGIDPESADSYRQLAGVRNDVWDGYKKITLNLLDTSAAIEAWRRKIIGDTEFDAYLQAAGFAVEDFDTIKKLAFQLPPIQDLITMMVRDTFNEDVVRRYGYDEDFPAQAAELGRQIGLAPEQTKRYWRAHWNLPSPTQAQEMVFRAGLKIDDYRTLLRIADYPPFWRPYFEKIIYSPFTRVDIRRMYQTTVLKEEEVFAAYKEIGYDDFHAQKLTDFTITLTTEEEKDLTKADVLGAYADDIYTKNETSAALEKLGYDPAEAALLLARADKDKSAAAQREAEAATKAQFTAGQITEAQAVSQLATAGVSEARIKALVATWKVTRDARVAKPSQAQMARFYNTGIIQQRDYEDYLKAEGFKDDYIKWLVQDAAPTGVTPEARVLSQSQIVSAFIADTLAEADARTRLAASGLAETEVAVLMDKAIADKKARQQREVASLTRLQFVNAIIEEGQARSALGAVDYTPLETDALIAEWSRTRQSRLAAQAETTRKELSKSDALNLYKLNKLNRPDTLESLVLVGYSSEDAELLVAGADAQLAERAASNAIDLARTQYINGQIDRQGAQNVLAGGGLTVEEIAARIAEWDRSLELRQVRLTQAQAFRLLHDGIIDLAGYGAYLRLLGYRDAEYDALLAQAQAALAAGA